MKQIVWPNVTVNRVPKDANTVGDINHVLFTRTKLVKEVVIEVINVGVRSTIAKVNIT